MQLLSCRSSKGELRIAMIDGDRARLLATFCSLYELANATLVKKVSFRALVEAALTDEVVAIAELESASFSLPVMHPDPARCLVTGTGLTHLGSATIRDEMAGNPDAGSHSLRMYRTGLDGGKPAQGQIGSQPEWFFKGNGHCLVPSGAPIEVPEFSLTIGEEPELAGIYIIDEHRKPHRIGFTLANDWSDHALEEQNYLYVAPSKLRQCSIGPVVWTGPVPSQINGVTRISRGGKPIWEEIFETGEMHMTHSIANLEHHHFKHTTLLNPGDIHIHLFGAPIFSYGAGIALENGDRVEIRADGIPLPLVNTLVWREGGEEPVRVAALDRFVEAAQ